MQVITLVGAAAVLLFTVGVGTIAHELTHAMVLRAFGVSYEIELFGRGVERTWATVTPCLPSKEVPPWGLRLAAIAPLVLAIPLVLVLVGILPDPLALENLFLTAATVAWFGCALPSPRDFSLFWHAERAIDVR